MPVLWGCVVAGVGYLLLTLVFNVDEVFEVFEVFSGDDNNFGCGTLAAVLAVFGAVGIAAQWANLSLAWTLVGALGTGVVVGGIVYGVVRYAQSQQGTDVRAIDDLVGSTVRVTVNSPAGATGQVLADLGGTSTFPARAANGGPLQRGDELLVVGIEGGRVLLVKAKNQAQP